jgi:PRC-barrel domain protein
VNRESAEIKLRVVQAACSLRFLLRSVVMTLAAAAAALALVALAYAQAPAPETPKADAAQPESPSPQSPPQAAVPPGTPATATVMSKGDVQGVLGKDVRSTTDEDMGHIVDVIVDSSGEPRAAIIDFGGFLGVGSRKVAVDWNALHFTPGDNPSPVTLDLTKDQVKAAPEYAEKKPVVILGAAGLVHPMPQDEPAKPE